jgi:hypothetical protein
VRFSHIFFYNVTLAALAITVTICVHSSIFPAFYVTRLNNSIAQMRYNEIFVATITGVTIGIFRKFIFVII